MSRPVAAARTCGADLVEPPTWSVIVPVKELHAAKSRLRRPDRQELALAMARDTVAAAAAARLVAQIVVVTDDPRALLALQGPGVLVLPDSPRAGLNAALRHAAAELRRAATVPRPPGGLATLSADLPALRARGARPRPRERRAAPQGVPCRRRRDRHRAADRAGGSELGPEYGPGSRLAHLASGAYDLTPEIGERVPGLRRDVDTVADLTAAGRLGTGPATRSVAPGN